LFDPLIRAPSNQRLLRGEKMSETLAIAVLVFLAMLRFGLPVFAIVGIGYAMDRLATRWEMDEFIPATD
jgi:hypothetical protein